MRWLAFALAVPPAGCGGSDDDAPGAATTIDSPGSGPPNAAALWPLARGYSAFGDSGRIVISDAQDEANETHYTGQFSDRSFELLQNTDGIYLVDAPEWAKAGRLPTPVLFIPATVRVGMRWTVPLQIAPHFPADGATSFPKGPLKFEVTGVEERTTDLGTAPVWTIEWKGPRDVHDSRRFAASEVDPVGGSMEFMEGRGPLGGAPYPLLHYDAAGAFVDFMGTKHEHRTVALDAAAQVKPEVQTASLSPLFGGKPVLERTTVVGVTLTQPQVGGTFDLRLELATEVTRNDGALVREPSFRCTQVGLDGSFTIPDTNGCPPGYALFDVGSGSALQFGADKPGRLGVARDPNDEGNHWVGAFDGAARNGNVLSVGYASTGWGVWDLGPVGSSKRINSAAEVYERGNGYLDPWLRLFDDGGGLNGEGPYAAVQAFPENDGAVSLLRWEPTEGGLNRYALARVDARGSRGVRFGIMHGRPAFRVVPGEGEELTSVGVSGHLTQWSIRDGELLERELAGLLLPAGHRGVGAARLSGDDFIVVTSHGREWIAETVVTSADSPWGVSRKTFRPVGDIYLWKASIPTPPNEAVPPPVASTVWATTVSGGARVCWSTPATEVSRAGWHLDDTEAEAFLINQGRCAVIQPTVASAWQPGPTIVVQGPVPGAGSMLLQIPNEPTQVTVSNGALGTFEADVTGAPWGTFRAVYASATSVHMVRDASGGYWYDCTTGCGGQVRTCAGPGLCSFQGFSGIDGTSLVMEATASTVTAALPSGGAVMGDGTVLQTGGKVVPVPAGFTAVQGMADEEGTFCSTSNSGGDYFCRTTDGTVFNETTTLASGTTFLQPMVHHGGGPFLFSQPIAAGAQAWVSRIDTRDRSFARLDYASVGLAIGAGQAATGAFASSSNGKTYAVLGAGNTAKLFAVTSSGELSEIPAELSSLTSPFSLFADGSVLRVGGGNNASRYVLAP